MYDSTAASVMLIDVASNIATIAAQPCTHAVGSGRHCRLSNELQRSQCPVSCVSTYVMSLNECGLRP